MKLATGGRAAGKNSDVAGKLAFRADINGLRALAVLVVVAFHFGISPFSGGFIGVDVFFVLSGYLMTGIILSKIEGNRFSLSQFYLDRARRIVPPLIIMIATVLLVGFFWLLPDEYLILAKHSGSSATFLSNILYWREIGYFDPGAEQKFLLHTWSLSVEWQFYILYPLLVFAVYRFGRSAVSVLIILLGCVSFALMVWFSHTQASTGFYLLPSRAWEMLVGGAVFLIRPFRYRLAILGQLVGLGLIIGSAILMPLFSWPSALALAPVVGTALVLLADRRDSGITGNPVVRWVGLNSYSIYLWHWPIVVFLIRENLLSRPVWLVFGIAASFLLGHLSWRFVEQWGSSSRRWRQNTPLASRRNWQSHLLFVSCVGLVVCASAAIWVTRGVPQRFSSVVRAIDEDARPMSVAGSAPCFSHGQEVPEPCIVGPSTKRVAVILLGDSHAEASLAAVIAALPSKKEGGVAFNAYGLCPPVIGGRSLPGGSRCDEYIERYVKPLTEPRTTPVILAAYWSTYDNERFVLTFPGGKAAPNALDFEENMVKSACALAKGGPTYIVLPLPEFPFWVSRELQKRLIKDPAAPEITIPRQAYEDRTRNLTPVFKKAAMCGVRLLDPVPFLCDEKKCIGSTARRALFRDENHLSRYGAMRLVPMYRQVFEDQEPQFGGSAER